MSTSRRLSAGCFGPKTVIHCTKNVFAWVRRRKASQDPQISADDLPLDVWSAISVFLDTDVLSEVCTLFRYNLPRNNVQCILKDVNATAITNSFARDPTIHQLTVGCKGLTDKKGWQLAMLGQMPSVEVLTLQLNVHQFGNTIGDRTVAALAALRNIPTLRSLSVDMHRSEGGTGSGVLTDTVGEALAALKDAPALETLSLDLSYNLVGANGLHALVNVATAQRLHSLELTLSSLPVLDAGAEALARLQYATSLRTLRLVLKCTGITDIGLQSLAELINAPALHSLSLDFNGCPITDAGVQAFVNLLKGASHLTSLALNFSATKATDAGLQAVSGLKDIPMLQNLTLALGPDVGDDTADALGMLVDATKLQSLSLDLQRTRIGDAGAASLARFRDAHSLTLLTVDLSSSAIGDSGAESLAKLRESRTLENITLDVSSTHVGPKGFKALSQLCSSQDMHLVSDPQSVPTAVQQRIPAPTTPLVTV